MQSFGNSVSSCPFGLFGAFTVCALSMIGLPLLSGFVTKWHLFTAALDAGQYSVVIAVVLSGLLNAAYFLPVLWAGWFGSDVPYAKSRLSLYNVSPIMLTLFVVWMGTASAQILQLMASTIRQMLRW